jgi:uncharacterized glyoxalase superfamily protein PhnB
MTIIPTLRYKDPRAAIAFLERAFGFNCKAIHEGEDGSVAHSEVAFGGDMIMIGASKPGDRFETGRAVLYAVVADPDEHFERARAAGAEILMELTDQPYGSREYAAADPEGNVWSFGTYDPLRA